MEIENLTKIIEEQAKPFVQQLILTHIRFYQNDVIPVDLKDANIKEAEFNLLSFIEKRVVLNKENIKKVKA